MLFSGYRVQHPLEPAIQCKIQTRSDNPGPAQAVQTALSSLIKELDTFETRFNDELRKKQTGAFQGALASGGMDTDDPMLP